MLAMLGSTEILIIGIAIGLCGLVVSGVTGVILFLLMRRLAAPAPAAATERRLEALEHAVADLRRARGS